MKDDALGDSTAPHAGRPPHRLSILHLMVWTFGCAIILTLYQMSTRLSPGQAMSPLLLGSYVFYGGLSGICVSAGLLIPICAVQRRKTQIEYPCDPGHWILSIYGISLTVSNLAWIFFLMAFDPFRPLADPYNYHQNYWWVWNWARIFFNLATGAVFLGYAARTKERATWRILLIALGVRSLYDAIAQGMSFTLTAITWASMLSLLTIPVILGATRSDLRHRVERDWLHWLGIAVLLLLVTYWGVMPWLYSWSL